MGGMKRRLTPLFDFGVTVIVSGLSLILEIGRGVPPTKDWTTTMMFWVFCYFLASLFLSLRFFWPWSVVACLGITAGSILGDLYLYPHLPHTLDWFIKNMMGNAVFNGVSSLPVACFIYYLRKNAPKDSPTDREGI